MTIDPLTTSLLADLDEINSVADMADAIGMSARQLQRVLKRTTGFSPHDLLKILRLQKSFVQDYQESYTDQYRARDPLERLEVVLDPGESAKEVEHEAL